MIESKKIKLFEKKINYKFKNSKLLIQSLTHPSFFLESEKKIKINEFERFEFLGDRVLGLIIANLLFSKYKKFNEGDLSKKYSYLVQKKFLFKISQKLQIDDVLQYNFKKKNNKMLNSIFSDSVEFDFFILLVNFFNSFKSRFISKRILYKISLSDEKSFSLLFSEINAGKLFFGSGKYDEIISPLIALSFSKTDNCSVIFFSCLILPFQL